MKSKAGLTIFLNQKITFHPINVNALLYQHFSIKVADVPSFPCFTRHIKGGRFQYPNNAYIGLALPGEAGSWQKESKGYQFWTRADTKGNSVINNIVPGDYNLYAWVPGFIGDYRYNATITITPGGVIKLDSLICTYTMG
ncbi:Rhamnogalacturonan lyase, domain II [Sesbania bispinosa]|nr:Rhamnogalacturonan lyase, domain II [Sesbania bispinosa]